MAISGIFVGAIIDLVRTVIEEMSPKSFIRKFSGGIELLVWALLGVCTFIILFYIKGGEWRLIDPLAQIFGIFLYETVFQPLFRFVGRIIFLIIIKPFFLIIRAIFSLLKTVTKIIYSIILIFLTPFTWIYAKFFKKHIHKTLTKTRKSTFKN